MNSFREIDEFEELFRASPVPKVVQDQWHMRKGIGTEGKFLLSSSLRKPVTKKVTLPGQKARLLQRMQGRPTAPTKTRYRKGNESINPAEDIPKESMSALELVTYNTTLNLSNKLSVTLPEGNNNIHTKPTREGLLTIPSPEFSPVKTSTSGSKMETPVLKDKIDNILSNLTVSDSEDNIHSKVSQKEGCHNPRQLALYFDAKSTYKSAEVVEHYSSQDSILPGRGRVTSETENTSSNCDDSDTLVEHSDSEIKKLSFPSEKINAVPAANRQAFNSTWSGSGSQHELEDTPTSCRSTGIIVEDGPKHVLTQWIIRPLDQFRGVCVEGHKSGDPEEQFWHSSVIVTRVDNKTVLTSTGTVYRLDGDIQELDALEAGIPRSLVKKFKDGFPHDWEKLIKNFYLRKTKQKTGKMPKAAFTGIKTEKPNLRSRRRTCDTTALEGVAEVFLPVPSPVLEDLPRTRSGRTVKPLLAFWAGQRVRVHNKTGHVEITPVESPSLERSQIQAKQQRGNNQSKCNAVNKLQKVSKSSCVKTDKRNLRTTCKTEGETKCSMDTMKKICNTDSVVVLSDICKESRLKDNCIQQTNKGAKSADRLSLELDVLSVIRDHKRKRLSQRKAKSTETCYSKAGDKFSDSTDVDSDSSTEQIATDSSAPNISSAVEAPVNHRQDMRAKTAGKKNEQSITSSGQPEKTSNSQEGIVQTGRRTRSSQGNGTRTTRAMSIPETCTDDVHSSYDTRSSRGRKVTRQNQANSAVDVSSDSSLEKTNEQCSKEKPKRKIVLKKKAQPKKGNNRKDSSMESVEKPQRTVNKSSGKSEGAEASLPLVKSSSEQKLEDSENGSEKHNTAIRRTRSNRRKDKKSASLPVAGPSDEASDYDYQLRKTLLKSNLNSRTKQKASSKKGKAESTMNSNTWTKKETDALYGAVKKHSPDDPSFWMLVSAAVVSKTREECQEFYYRSAETDRCTASKTSKTKTRASLPVTLTGGVGTLKRKRELRELVEQHNEGYEDDYFDSTPMRKQTSKAPVFDDDDDDIFGDKLPFDTPAASRTPFLKHMEPVSTRKTPHIHGETPGYGKSVDRKEMDRYIHRLKKRRRIVPELTNIENKKLVTADNVEYNYELFSKEEEVERDSEEESDYYWSDDLG